MSHKSINAVANINKAQLHDDVEELLTANGFTLNDLQRLEKQNEYRRLYSQRPNVVEKRKAYSAARYAKMKVLRDLLKQHVG